jgi:hypothetical protein
MLLELRRGQDEVQETLRTVLSSSGNVWLDTESMSDTERQDFRCNSMLNYDSHLSELGIDSISKLRAHEQENGTHLPKCMVTGVSHQIESGKVIIEVRSAHIWPARARRSADIKTLELLGLEYGDISSYRNSVLLLRSLEQQFDKQRISFAYNFVDDSFLFRVIDSSLWNTQVAGAAAGVTFGSLDGLPLQLPKGKFPFRRLLVYHYAMALDTAGLKHWTLRHDLPALPEASKVESWLKQQSPDAKWPGARAYARIAIAETRRASQGDE